MSSIKVLFLIRDSLSSKFTQLACATQHEELNKKIFVRGGDASGIEEETETRPSEDQLLTAAAAIR